MLTTAQWDLLRPMFVIRRNHRGRGRPRKHALRDMLEGVLWVLKTGARWKDLPRGYPAYQTCHRWFQRWVREGTLKRAMHVLARDLRERGKLNLSECYIDASFAPAKKGDSLLVRPNGERVRNSWQLQTALLILSPSVQSLLHPTRLPSLRRP